MRKTPRNYKPKILVKRPPGNEYAARNSILKKMGFRTYSDYLGSPLWRAIKIRVLRACSDCYGCAGPAIQVHHQAYDESTLRGTSLKRLKPICVECHRLIEFDKKSKKTTPKQANRMLEALREKRLLHEAGGY